LFGQGIALKVLHNKKYSIKKRVTFDKSRYFSNEATDDIIEYLKTLEINCSWVYPSITTHEETLIKFSARGIVSNTKIK
jgi:hypothetical protein